MVVLGLVVVFGVVVGFFVVSGAVVWGSVVFSGVVVSGFVVSSGVVVSGFVVVTGVVVFGFVVLLPEVVPDGLLSVVVCSAPFESASSGSTGEVRAPTKSSIIDKITAIEVLIFNLLKIALIKGSGSINKAAHIKNKLE